MMAAIKAVPICKVCCTTNNNHHHCYYYSKKIGVSESGFRRFGSGLLNLRLQSKWECALGGVLSEAQRQRAITPVEEDDKSSVVSPGGIEQTQITQTRGFHKDLQSLPSE